VPGQGLAYVGQAVLGLACPQRHFGRALRDLAGAVDAGLAVHHRLDLLHPFGGGRDVAAQQIDLGTK
jgi:hypothetical protein